MNSDLKWLVMIPLIFVAILITIGALIAFFVGSS